MLLLISFVWRWEIPRDHARKNVEFQRIMQSTVKQDIFTCAKLFQNILFSKPFSNMQNLNKIKYFTPGKMHRKTYSFTSLILHPGKITWPQECRLTFQAYIIHRGTLAVEYHLNRRNHIISQ